MSRHLRSWAGLCLAIALAVVPASNAAGAQPFETNVTHGLGAGEPELAIDPVHHTLVISFE